MNLEYDRVLRFLLVGAGNTLFGYFIYSISVLLGASFSVSILIATIVGVFFNFYTIGIVVFCSLNWSRIYLFILMYFFSYLLNLYLLNVLINYGFTSLLSGAISIPLVSIVTYIGLRNVVFRDLK